MAVRTIRTEGDEALRKRCKEVKNVDERVRALLDDMMDTLHATEGAAALAANQVGILKRLVVIDYCGCVLRTGRRSCSPARERWPNVTATSWNIWTGRCFWIGRWRCIILTNPYNSCNLNRNTRYRGEEQR